MAYCPYCGSTTKTDELFCIQCGEKLPTDIDSRKIPPKRFFRFIHIPILIALLSVIACTSYYFYLQSQTKQANASYEKAENYLLDEDYQEARIEIEAALEHNSNFPAAQELQAFTELALTIKNDIENKEAISYQDALVEINEGKKELSSYNGEAVIQLTDKLETSRIEIQLKKVKEKLEGEPSIQTLQTTLWEAEGIQNPEAMEIATSIREQIIAYSSTTANQLLQEKQFSEARSIVANALQYAPDSEKLSSLKTTIEKEKTAFETAQEKRIEQALTAVEAERDLNNNDAVELTNAALDEDDQGNIVIFGELKSVATVPINSIAITYNIIDKVDNIIETNEIYVYPETLYPDEVGKFDHTHYDLTDKNNAYDVKIETIKWFID
ncbi:zinc ribbon domain-containing protein [Paraliobacillus sediminis]|uniref:zinc ribbon domain-containing protein n=1 Tax=Paraliobacillus sediminis TaxID=1885916 RepID=UPI000E3B9C97|nr:zinc ribbon domain-containing protein [Paraliobacillus sediminis]